jgi:hypothetical protein
MWDVALSLSGKSEAREDMDRLRSGLLVQPVESARIQGQTGRLPPTKIDLRVYAGVFQTLDNLLQWRPPVNAPYLDERKDQYHIGIGFWMYEAEK